jgi:predicted tellurium resistance membrane protein TerC
MEWLTDPQIWASLLTLTTLEIVLGIDNLVFVAILAGRLPSHQQAKGRRIGLALALITRLLLLASISWIIGLTQPLFAVLGHDVSWRDVILVGGGVFLLYKGTSEIHERLEGDDPAGEQAAGGRHLSLGRVVTQIMILDIVFSLDSVITAVGMANQLWVMSAAVVIASMIMLAGSSVVSRFIEAHPTVKMLALSFLLLIGMTLIADGVGFPVPKGFVYAAIGFSMAVESLNLVASRRKLARRHRAGVRAA